LVGHGCANCRRASRDASLIALRADGDSVSLEDRPATPRSSPCSGPCRALSTSLDDADRRAHSWTSSIERWSLHSRESK
jgi:hypothetical protein